MNHPRMIEQGYSGDSGKLEDITHMLENAIAERFGRIEPAKLRTVVEVLERLRADG